MTDEAQAGGLGDVTVTQEDQEALADAFDRGHAAGMETRGGNDEQTIITLEAKIARQEAAMREAVEARLPYFGKRGISSTESAIRAWKAARYDELIATLTTLLSNAPERGEGEQS